MDFGCLMKIVKYILVAFVFNLSFSVLAEESSVEVTQGFISDDLFIYMHSGAGNNFRILGSINSGTEIKLTGLTENEYTQIIDNKSRNAWVESKYVSTTPGLRFVIAELNGKLANTSDSSNQLETQLANANSSIEKLTALKNKLNQDIKNINKELKATSAQLKDQDTNIKKEWFFNGAIVLVIGLIFGLLIPRLTARRKSNMDSWK